MTRDMKDRKPRQSTVEAVASLMHDIWAQWAEWMLSKVDTEGRLSNESVYRWRRQICTRYDDLTEEEKQSDRAIAERVLSTLDNDGESGT